MEIEPKPDLIKNIKNLVIGGARSPKDPKIFHKISLIAFFAWIGLGADGLTSSCYGPQEAFLALNGHIFLSIFVALGTVLTIFVVCESYSQIVELFPSGGGGYLVASKLLSPGVGMLSGCALLIDYVLTITVSIASGADAIFSFLPIQWQSYRVPFAVLVVMTLMIMNMRGVKESVIPLVPIFIIFLLTHVFIIVYVLGINLPKIPDLAVSTSSDIHRTVSDIGIFGMLFLIMRSYSMGAGTYTGIEAVSNGIPVLREPRVQTAKRTMLYMALSLSFMVFGLMVSYIFYKITPQTGKTLNAILFEQATGSWNMNIGYTFVLVALLSEGVLLFVAAQTGFLDGPRVLANMAKDRWLPTRFATLSDRLVIQNGILIMGGFSLVLMVLTHGSVRFLVVLYSINVFITFSLSQLGMVRHWWNYRSTVKEWFKKLLVNGVGLILTLFILLSMIILKFDEGGWITLLITGALVGLAILIKRHYSHTMELLHRLDSLVGVAESSAVGIIPSANKGKESEKTFDPKAKTAIFLVNGFNGMGLHTLLNTFKLFGDTFKNFVFVQVGVIDAGNFKGVQEVDHLQCSVSDELNRYVNFVNKQGYYAEAVCVTGVDVIEEISNIAPKIAERFPDSVFFGGQLVFPNDSFVTRWLHNYKVFALQKRLYHQGIPFVILPIRVLAS